MKKKTTAGRWEDLRRTPPEQLEEQRRWAPYALEGATLSDLRKLVGATQQQLGDRMKVSDVEASRFERRTDVQLSTLERYLRALGGTLEVYARFEEKLVPLRIGAFDHRAFAELVASRIQDGTFSAGVTLDEVREAFRIAQPLQRSPTPDQILVALVMVRERLGRKASPALEALKDQAKRAARPGV